MARRISFFRKWAYVLRFVSLWGTIVALMLVARMAFFLFEPLYDDVSFSEVWNLIVYGLPTDFTTSAYLMVIPGILLIVRLYVNRKWVENLSNAYLILISVILSGVYILDAVLFPFWQFRLDTTPFFYFFSSPSSAFASLPMWENIVIIVIFLLLSFLLFCLFRKVLGLYVTEWKTANVKWQTVALIVLTALLFLPARGGVSEATMTPGRGFYSNDNRLNQATVNPLFSLLYSLIHHDNPATQFRYVADDAEARSVLEVYEQENITSFSVENSSDISTSAVTLSDRRPDIYLVILESFSAQLMPSLGGQPIATGLDSIAAEGVLFTDFYAESFRTDRALPAILSGYPAQPTTSLMRFTSKLGNVPSLAKVLKRNGWDTNYFYGGDSDFTNMKAYLKATGFDNISDKYDYPSALHVSKWGVPDEYIFSTVMENLTPEAGRKPRFTVIQTSSSHEPFDIGLSRFGESALNSFAYTDSCLFSFVETLKGTDAWQHSLVVIVPDHWGCWPENLDDFQSRHHIPLVLTGGALKSESHLNGTIGSQADIAPTVLGLLGLPSDEFVFGHDLFDANQPHYARIAERDRFALIGSDGNLIPESVETTGVDKVELSPSKAFMQLLYSDLTDR